MAYSVDYRKRAVEYYREGHTEAEVSDAFKIGPPTLHDWEARYDRGDLAAQYPKSRAPRKIPLHELVVYVDAHPEDFQREIGEHFKCSHQAVSKALAKMGYTNKKNGRLCRT
jgi:transposase